MWHLSEMTDVAFSSALGDAYTSRSQKIRVLSERWVSDQLRCPACDAPRIRPYANNSRIADFRCDRCAETFELKSHKGRLGRKIVDGAYAAMIERLTGGTNPNFLLLQYHPERQAVVNLVLLPKHFFVPAIIEQRRPLSPSARRAGWVGCNIRLGDIPDAGKIHLIRDGQPAPQQGVLDQWQAMAFLRDSKTVQSRGWVLSVLRCIERLPTPEFSLLDVYRFEAELVAQFPGNQNVRPKIRQQLQVLRDQGYLEFLGNGAYRIRRRASSD